MIKSLVFDKDGVILDLIGTWFPVVQALADYTIERQPSNVRGLASRATLLASVGVDDATGSIDPMGLFASGSFAEIRATWQALLPPEMINLEHDISYRAEVKRLVRELAHGNTIPKGDVATPLRKLADAGFKLAVLTNDSESSARQNLVELGIEGLFDPVIGADSGYGGKPEPKGLLSCCAEHGSDPAETLMVGDTGADYGAAVRAQVADFICIADDPDWRPHSDVKVENCIPRLSDLPDLLIRLGYMEG